MSNSGHGYGAGPGYYPPPPYPYPMYHGSPPVPALQPSTSFYASVQGQGGEAATSQPYHGSPNAIPGLALTPGNATTQTQQNQWTGLPSNSWNFTPQNPIPNLRASQTTHASHKNNHVETAYVAEHMEEDAAEEGEISEGELEDLYEPKETDDIADADVYSPRHPHFDEPMNLPSNRSGSYSPYLSPHEVRPAIPHRVTHDINSHPKAQEEAPSETRGVASLSKSKNAADKRTLEDAKKQAHDAIIRLQPLNIRYEDFLKEGIDATVLQGLFRELGFDFQSSPVSDVQERVPQAIVPSEPPISKPPKAQVPIGSSEEELASQKPKDKSEERKDRIARLLAAKGSKSSVPLPSPSLTTTTPLEATDKAATTKKQSEKSKLLQQKMEALRKSREARDQQRNDEEATTSSNVSNAPIADPTTTNSLEPNEKAVDTPEVSGSSPHDDTSNEDARGQPTSSIPGLYLSSTPQPPQTVGLVKQQSTSAAANIENTTKAFERPFGHGRESRQFLIEVSDDEDDAEMDIDSEGQRSTSIARDTPPPRGVDFVGHFDVSRHALGSPVSFATPPRGLHEISGKKDLESMNKKIEAMKRKIAEAEARKKAKESRQASPALSPSNNLSRGGSSAALSSAKDASRVDAMGQVDGSSALFFVDTTPRRLPKVAEARRQSNDNERRSRSRAASERLTIVEARRKEQLLKLQLLQSQMANIQKELEESMTEEQKLREDVDSDSGAQEAGQQTADHSSPEAQDSPQTTVHSAPPQEAISTIQSSVEAEVIHQLPEYVPAQPLSQILPSPNIADSGRQGSREENVKSAAPETGSQAAAMEVAGEEESDVDMHDANDGDDTDESEGSVGSDIPAGSDRYEPPDANDSDAAGESSSSFSPASAGEGEILEASDNEGQDAVAAIPLTQQISAGNDTPSESGREVNQGREASASSIKHSSFAPYESPLQYFHSYRFHPQFSQNVPGGLRSLTYSNKIDARKELCPDELAGRKCPRGSHCQFQHFDNLQTPDDQILLQLGAFSNGEDTPKQEEYINGLRQLLTEFRSRKVKDFQTISQGIIEYRAQFLRDKSKILPLGGVAI